MKCFKCGFAAIQLLTSVSCINKECNNYDTNWEKDYQLETFQDIIKCVPQNHLYEVGKPIRLSPNETFTCEITFPVQGEITIYVTKFFIPKDKISFEELQELVRNISGIDDE